MMAASRATIPMMSIAREVCTPSLSLLSFSPHRPRNPKAKRETKFTSPGFRDE